MKSHAFLVSISSDKVHHMVIMLWISVFQSLDYDHAKDDCYPEKKGSSAFFQMLATTERLAHFA